MKKVLTLCTMMVVLIGLIVIAAPTAKAPQAPTTPVTVVTAASGETSTPDMKAELESLIAEIKAAKEAGLTPNPALLARLEELMPSSPARGSLDQGGEDWANATVIPTTPYSDVGVLGATNDCPLIPYNDVFYVYTVQAAGSHTFDMCGTAGDTYLRLWKNPTGTCAAALQYTSDDVCIMAPQISVVFAVGDVVYIELGNYSTGTPGSYQFHVSAPAPPPPGDVCATALPLTVPGTVTGNTNLPFNNDYDFACPYSGSTSRDVVYSYTPIQTELVSLSLCSAGSITNYDSKLYVYAGSCVNPPVACNDDACSTPYYSSYVSRLDCVPLTGGITYYIVVDGYGGSNGNYTLDATICQPCPPPPNDDCVNAPVLPLPATFTGTRDCATPDCPIFQLGQGNVWIAFEVPAACDVVLDYCGSPATGNAWLNLALGCPCTGYTVGGTYDFTTCGDGNVTVRWVGLAPGIYYYPVLRDDESGASGPYTIHVACQAPPPCIVDFTLLAPGGLSGYTTVAGDDCPANPGPEQIVEVHIPYTGMWTFSLCHGGTTYDSWLDLRDACCGALIASNDDACGGLTSELPHVPLNAGTYYLAVEGYASDTGPWELTVTACRQRVDFDPIVIPQSVCVTLNNAMHTDLVIGGQPGDPFLNPNEAPIVTVQPGCDPALTNCNDPDCPPFTGLIDIVWVFVPDSVIMCDCGYPGCNCPPVIIHGGWYAVIVNMDGWIGCVCITLEGFEAVALNSFSAVARDGEVELTWSTASETNNARFDVLRNGVTAAQIASQGNGASEHTYVWIDRDAVNGTTYTYTLVAVDVNGGREELATQSATPTAGAAVITEYALHQNYPNPFNPATTIVFDMVEAGNVTLKVYNLMGQNVATPVNGYASAGRHSVSFNATNLPSGIYLYKLEANGFAAEKKMMLMK